MQYVYIHGFGTTGAGSTKFKKIKQHAENNGNKAFALEWNENQENIVLLLLEQLNMLVDYSSPICLIGSSTGGNFTYQLLSKLEKVSTNIRFVLINPLIDVTQRKIENLSFPISLANQLQLPNSFTTNGLVLLGKSDEVLDANFTYKILKDNNQIIFGKEWNHTLSNLETNEFLHYIDSFLIQPTI